jgi:arylsulfatase A-like enzyme
MKRLPILVAVACAAIGCTRDSARTPTGKGFADNVILISIDSLRADHVGAYGYGKPTTPFVDSLARSGTVFDRAYSTTSWTLPSHVAMLTGLDNRAHQVLGDTSQIPDSVEMLAQSLQRQGIHTAGFYSGPYLQPAYGFARGFHEYVNCSTITGDPTGLETHLQSYRDVTNPILLRELTKWAESGKAERRNFLFIHMWDVHYNYEPPADYLKMFEDHYDGSMPGEVWGNKRFVAGMDPRDLEHLVALYDGEIRYTDDTIKQLFEIFRANGLLDNAAVIITADHGEEFLDHGGKGHHSTLYEEVLRVPLVLHMTGRTPGRPRVENVVSLVDIHPTVCRLFDAECSKNGGSAHELVSLLLGEKAEPREDALADLTVPNLAFRMSGLVRPQGKVLSWEGFALVHLHDTLAKQMIEEPAFEFVPGMERFSIFFDGEALKSERRGVAVFPGGEADSASTMLQELDRRVAEAIRQGDEIVGTKPRKEAEIDETTRQRLKDLGYRE